MGKNLSKLLFSVLLGILLSSEIVFGLSQANVSSKLSQEPTVSQETADQEPAKEVANLKTANAQEETPLETTISEADKAKTEPETKENTTPDPQPAPAKTENNSTPVSVEDAPVAPQSVAAPDPTITASVQAAATETPAASTAASTTTLQISGRTLTVIDDENMADDSGANVIRFRKLLRGHNSDQVFRVLYNMNSCDKSANCTFSLTEQGTTANYQIKSRVEYTVEDFNTGRLTSPDGNTTMFNLTTKAKGHDYALFTCFGEYDASIGRYKQVLVLYADRV